MEHANVALVLSRRKISRQSVKTAVRVVVALHGAVACGTWMCFSSKNDHGRRTAILYVLVVSELAL